MAGELVHVQFYGDVLDATQEDSKVWVSIRRCCDNLGLAVDAQMVKLKGKAWATITDIVMVAEDGKSRSVSAIDLETLPGWLFSIDARKVAEHVREKLARYQREAAKVLANHFLVKSDSMPIQAFMTELRLLREEVNTLRANQNTPATLPYTPATPRYTVRERCRWKGWHTTSYKQRAQVRRLANSLLDLRHQETPDVTGQVCVWWGHQLACLDEAIDRVKAEYETREKVAGPGLLAGAH